MTDTNTKSRVDKAIEKHEYNVVGADYKIGKTTTIGKILDHIKSDPYYVYIPTLRLAGNINNIRGYLNNVINSTPAETREQDRAYYNNILSDPTQLLSASNVNVPAAIAYIQAAKAARSAYSKANKAGKGPSKSKVNPIYNDRAFVKEFLTEVARSKGVEITHMMSASEQKKKNGVKEAKVFKDVVALILNPQQKVENGVTYMKMIDISNARVGGYYHNAKSEGDFTGSKTDWIPINAQNSRNAHVFGYGKDSNGGDFIFPVTISTTRTTKIQEYANGPKKNVKSIVPWADKLTEFLTAFVNSTAYADQRIAGLSTATVVPTARNNATSNVSESVGLRSARPVNVLAAGPGTPL